jgi:peptidoglycan/LPS O-acetylase OafA/YrhL
LAAIIVIAMVSGGSYRIISIKQGLRWGVRGALLPLIGGMITYTYRASNMPGSEALTEKLGTWGVLIIVLLGAGLGIVALGFWQMMENRKTKPVKA